MSDANDDLALSTDGTIVSYAGHTSLWSLDVRIGVWRRADYPSGFRAGRDYGVSITAQAAEMAWMADSGGWWQIDVQTGKADEIRVPDYVHDVAFAPHGVLFGVGSAIEEPHFVRTIVQQTPSGQLVWEANWLWSLTGLSSDGESLAAMRGVGMSGPGVADTDRNGLIALSVEDWSTRAYLPIADPHFWYSDGGALQPITWLDADTVLVSVVSEEGGYGSGARTLFTWHVETGEMHRLSSLPASSRVDVASGIL